MGQAVLWGGLTHDSAPKLLADRAPHIHSGVMQHLSRRVGVTSGYPTQSSNPVNYSSAASGIWVHPYQCPVSVDLAVREACERIKRLRDMLEWQYAHSLFGPCDIPGPISQAHLAFRMRLFRIRDMARRCEETSSNTKVLCIPCGFDGIAEASQSGWFRRSCQITICTDSTGNNQFTDLPFLGGEDPAASQVKTICHEMAHCQGNTNHNNYGSWGAGNADEAGNWCDGCYDSIMSGGGCRMCGTWGVPGAAAHPQYCPSTHW